VISVNKGRRKREKEVEKGGGTEPIGKRTKKGGRREARRRREKETMVLEKYSVPSTT